MAQIGIRYDLVTPRGTLTFNGFENDAVNGFSGDYLRLTEIEGLDAPALRTPLENRPQVDGAVAYEFLRGARYPGLRGQIVARGADALTQRNVLEDRLKEHLHSILAADGTLKWPPTGSVGRQLTVRAWEPLQISGDWLKEFRLGLVAADPDIVSQSLTVIEDTAAPWSLDFNNVGNAPPRVKLRVYGSVGAPVTAVTVGHDIGGTVLGITFTGLNLNSAAAILEVDLYRRTTNFPLNLPPGEWDLALTPGINTMVLTDLTGTPSKFELEGRSAWA